MSEIVFLEYIVQNPGQGTAALVIIFIVWAVKKFAGIGKQFESHTKAMTECTHLLVGVDGQNGIRSEVKGNTETIKQHEERINQTEKDIVFIKAQQ